MNAHEFVFYVAGWTGRSAAAFATIQRIVRRHLSDDYTIEVVNVLEDPRTAEKDGVYATPMLVRRMPLPQVRLVGDMANEVQVIRALNLDAGKDPS